MADGLLWRQARQDVYVDVQKIKRNIRNGSFLFLKGFVFAVDQGHADGAALIEVIQPVPGCDEAPARKRRNEAFEPGDIDGKTIGVRQSCR